jgi:hypothetical protein
LRKVAEKRAEPVLDTRAGQPARAIHVQKVKGSGKLIIVDGKGARAGGGEDGLVV